MNRNERRSKLVADTMLELAVDMQEERDRFFGHKIALTEKHADERARRMELQVLCRRAGALIVNALERPTLAPETVNALLDIGAELAQEGIKP